MKQDEMLVFWGAGQKCIFALDLLTMRQKDKVEWIVDSDSKKWNRCIYGIEVISPEEFYEHVGNKKTVRIYITFSECSDLRKDLIGKGFSEECILTINFARLLRNYIDEHIEENGDSSTEEKEVFFDMENGFCMGGIESWVYRKREFYSDLGYNVKYLVRDINPYAMSELWNNVNESEIVIGNNVCELRGMIKIANRISSSRNAVVISNFINRNFMSACIAKKKNPHIYHVVVIHSDADCLYELVAELCDFIDLIVIVSEKMRTCLKKYCVPEIKVKKMLWNIPEDNTIREYTKSNEPIRIGYAGRLTIRNKRFDAALIVIKELIRRKVNFVFEYAGQGDYGDEFGEIIRIENLERLVNYKGVLNESELAVFWRSVDIMISFSDTEGHSISQCEAMSHGAVPIIPNVSGSNDDVNTGVDGFIYQIGYYNKAVDYIELLANDRKLLRKMGKEAKNRIKAYNEMERDDINWII